MKIAVLGTGGGGRAHAAKLLDLGHDVHVGTRDPEATLTRTEPDMMGNPPYQQFLAEHPGIHLHTFADAAAAADLVINGIDGASALVALTAIADQLAGKTLIDYAVPYLYGAQMQHPWPTPFGTMPKLDPCDTDSLAEQIQRALPDVKVVKSFVTQEQDTVVNPQAIGGDHTMFLAGNDAEAKQTVTELLKSYGWTDILDLGDLVAARGMEMYAHMHGAIGLALGIGNHFGVKIVR
ncbi:MULTISPECIES: NAD(P)-binding domain-containing protein [unclassified Streptomyces]|uniref:NADPH-dependent F420 reductase n=1 Tax=unclassified Streptomyces TaxID=2593676 RepID=UPI00036CD080|nr:MULTISPECIES: NAD(P)-binding domain-containing protein [unclassified Streptomyces]MYT32926.1 NAD(P)-binding domain-containing protein [Streptomyces sp. SID8354]